MKKTVYTNYDELPVMLSVPDVAQIMGIALDGAYTLVRSKDFPAFKEATISGPLCFLLCSKYETIGLEMPK